MVLNKIPTFDEVKDWVNGNTATSVNGETGDVVVDTSTPITSKDRAETFEESDVSVSHFNTETANGGVVFSDLVPATWDENGYKNDTSERGIIVNLDSDATELTATLSPSTANVNEVYLREADETLIAEKTDAPYNGGDTVTFTGVSLTANTDYILSLYRSGNLLTNGLNDYGTRSGGLDTEIVSGFDTGVSSQEIYGINEVSTPNDVPTDGEVTVEWPKPSDIYRWDAATFTATEDGEAVDVFVEESTDGSTWTEIQGPISRNDPINASADSEVRFRVDLSRNDTANNPTLDSIYRQWEV